MKASKHLILTVGILFSLLLIIDTSQAQTKWRKYGYWQNWGGLSDNLSTTEIQDNEATDLQNVIFDTGGAIKKRFGYTTVPDGPAKAATGTAACVTGLIFYKQDDGDRYLVAMVNNDTKATLMKKSYASGGAISNAAWDNIDHSSLDGTYTNNYQADFAVAQDVLVISDGTPDCNLFKWNGSGKATPFTTAAKQVTGAIIEYHKNQLFASGDSDYPSRTYFSNLDDIYTYTATDFFDTETSDGSKVRALISTLDSLYIFKDKSIWRLSGTNRDDFVLQKMVDGIGTLSNKSVQSVNNLIYFVTPQNDIAIYDGNYTVKFISQKIRGTIGGLNFSRAANAIGLAFSSYKYNDFDYYASMSKGTTNDTVLLFDTAFSAWTKFKGLDVNAWCLGDDNIGKNAIYFGDYSGYVHRYPSSSYYDGSVATSAINAYYQTKWFRYPEIALGDKYWRLLKVYANDESSSTGVVYLTAEARSDYEASGKALTVSLASDNAKWDASEWDIDIWGGTTIITGRLEVDKGVNMFQSKFSNSVVSQGFTLVGYELFVEGTDRI